MVSVPCSEVGPTMGPEPSTRGRRHSSHTSSILRTPVTTFFHPKIARFHVTLPPGKPEMTDSGIFGKSTRISSKVRGVTHFSWNSVNVYQGLKKTPAFSLKFLFFRAQAILISVDCESAYTAVNCPYLYVQQIIHKICPLLLCLFRLPRNTSATLPFVNLCKLQSRNK
jgi:hypothetical protein